MVTVALTVAASVGAVPGSVGTPRIPGTVPLVNATGTEPAASVVLGMIGTARDSVVTAVPDWMTTGLMVVASGGVPGVQYSGIVVTVTVTVPSRA